MSPLRSLQFRRDESDLSPSLEDASNSTEVAGSALPKSSAALDRYSLLRLRQAASTQPGDLVDFLTERSRASSATMSSQF